VLLQPAGIQVAVSQYFHCAGHITVSEQSASNPAHGVRVRRGDGLLAIKSAGDPFVGGLAMVVGMRALDPHSPIMELAERTDA
jgi:uncharacterized membrane protein